MLTKLDCTDEDRVVTGHNQQSLKVYKEQAWRQISIHSSAQNLIEVNAIASLLYHVNTPYPHILHAPN